MARTLVEGYLVLVSGEARARETRLAQLRPWIARARDFSGWSFDHLGIRRLGPPMPWDYIEVVAEHAARAGTVLDVDTGGGERLAAMRARLPARLVATEGWQVNLPIARRRLEPLNVDVVGAASESAMPFAGDSFDLVMNRHGALAPGEMARILRPGGVLVTQQVGPLNWPELRRHLPMTDWTGQRPKDLAGLREAGFELLHDETHEGQVTFPSLGEVVYMLQVTHEWELPDFSLDRYLDALLTIEAECMTGAGLVVTEAYYLIVARKPASLPPEDQP